MKITGTLSDEYSNSKGSFQAISFEIDLDLRDYFAAKAMQGLLSTEKHVETSAKKLAALSYQQADSMLLERSKNDK